MLFQRTLIKIVNWSGKKKFNFLFFLVLHFFFIFNSFFFLVFHFQKNVIILEHHYISSTFLKLWDLFPILIFLICSQAKFFRTIVYYLRFFFSIY